MGQAAAKKGDRITATDTHSVKLPQNATAFLPHSFSGIIDGKTSRDVNIMGQPAATADSTATNTPPHVPQGLSFTNSPSNKGTIKTGSGTVKINGKKAARNGDTAETCNDPEDLSVGQVAASGTVNIGG